MIEVQNEQIPQCVTATVPWVMWHSRRSLGKSSLIMSTLKLRMDGLVILGAYDRVDVGHDWLLLSQKMGNFKVVHIFEILSRKKRASHTHQITDITAAYCDCRSDLVAASLTVAQERTTTPSMHPGSTCSPPLKSVMIRLYQRR